ncbi:TRAP transporter large permease [Rubrimonas cliftonensis]|uniref:TRAP transporter large permease protein n=1 Tax=Rubrimonas cliftonensis TaxID=89524 RepID=A0A1H4G446_9RHOB|nr:TRAP transporter large permease [Rubrimonas cliftonensis]SEB03482.1 TRAP transporter, DctM subunit [Rubrimonas cliftonensis]
MILVIAAFALFLLMGMPVAFAIAGAAAMFFLQNPDLPYTIPAQQTITQTQNFALLAVPLFILAGNLMNHTGLTRRLLGLATTLLGHMRGGLAQASLALSAMMGGVSGSAIADASMQARMLGGEMMARGVSRGFTAAVLSFGSILTPVIPPGIGMILYGTIGQVSIGRLFAAGILPALLLWGALAVAVAVSARRNGWPPERAARAPRREVIGAIGAGLWAILFPVILLVGLRSGFFTPSEIGALAVVYALIIGIVVYRELTRGGFGAAMSDTVADIGAVMLLIAVSAPLSYVMVLERTPETIAGLIVGLPGGLEAVMVAVALAVILAGFVIDATVLIIMLTPILLPLIRSLGGDPVHFGIVFIIAATIGNFTPPVGAAMYSVCSILNCGVPAYSRAAAPLFLAVMLVVLALVFLPDLVLFLPRALI